MITHGNKQISEIVYARKASEGGGAVRLKNIIRGEQVVFGGIGPNVKNWLEKATKQAILGAFGQTDGYAVIKATNAYLNQLAVTDSNKATALAGFINYNADSAVGICQFFYVPELQAVADAGLLNLKQLADNSIFVQILHHHVKNGTQMFANSNDARYRVNGTELFSILKYISTWYLNNKYEFYAEQYNTEGSYAHEEIRWSQTSNPYTDGTCTGYTNISNSQRGLKYYNSYTLITDTKPWWGACGCWTEYNGGIPALKNTVCKGTLDLWIRVG